MMLVLFLITLAVQEKPASMEALLQQLSKDALEAREKASAAIRDRWESWTDRDLERLRMLGAAGETEAAVRARAAFTHIGFRRRYPAIPTEVWRQFPNVGELISEGDAPSIGKMLQELERKLDASELTKKDLPPVAIELVDDKRETGIGTGIWDMGQEWILSVQSLARGMLWRVCPLFEHALTKEQCRAWWTANKDKTEREWLLGGLSHKNQGTRGAIIARLSSLKEADLQPRLFEALDGIDEENSFDTALRGMSKGPGDRLFDYLIKRFKTAHVELKIKILMILSRLDHDGVEETLAKAFEDPEQEFKCMRGNIWNGRVCDFAAIQLARRMKIENEFEWPLSVDARDRNLEEIRNRWRKGRGLPLLPYHGPGVVLVEGKRVIDLVPELTREKDDRRKAAVRRLSELGPGAWKPFHELIETAGEPEKNLLVEAARTWANSLRSIEAQGETASGLVGPLKDGLHRPLDREAIAKLLLKWFDDSSLAQLTVVLTRGGNGRGFAIWVKTTKFGKPGYTPQTVWVSCDGLMYFRKWNRTSIEEETQKWFEKLDEEIMDDLDVPFEVYLVLKRAGPEGAIPETE